MDLRYIIATIHILTFGLGFYSCWARASALKKLKDENGIKDVLTADNLWGAAAALWLLTGLWRAFGGLEKSSGFYLHNTAFLIKMSLFALVFVLELRPNDHIDLLESVATKEATSRFDCCSIPGANQLYRIDLADTDRVDGYSDVKGNSLLREFNFWLTLFSEFLFVNNVIKSNWSNVFACR